MVTNILIEVMSSIAEQERIAIRQRQKEGIEAAKKKGKHLGRPVIAIPERFPEVYENWKGGRITAVYAMKNLGLKRGTFYRMAEQYERTISKKVFS